MNARAITAMLLAYVIPGGGHFYLGLRKRALAYFGIIVVLFLLGLSIKGGVYTLAESRESLLVRLATIGSMGSGALYFLALTKARLADVFSATYEYGRMFTLSAGLMNLLLVLDCYDIVRGRKE